jgi:glutamate/tyrosine decarboxylase-like PLP-dependent enzyme
MHLTLADDARRLPAILDRARAAAGAFLAGLPSRPVAARVPASLDLPPLPEVGWGAERALAYFVERCESLLSGSAGPRYLGFVTGGATPAALAGDWLASTYDQNLSGAGDSAATLVERHALSLLRALLGVPEGFEGIFVTGGTQANLVGLATARQWLGERRGVDVSEVGVAGLPAPLVVGGAPHTSVGKALSVLGLGRGALERVACLPGRQAVDPAALDARLRRDGDRPAIVVASAGEVNTGDFDDLVAVAEVARARGAWLHVDGAFGLFAACDPDRAGWLEGLGLADSIAGDAHKWLNVPYDSGFAFTRHPALQRRVFSAAAAYLGDGPDLMHLAPENSRRFRALPAFLTLLASGRDGHRALVQGCCAHAAALAGAVERNPRLELLAPPRLNIVCFAAREAGAGPRDRLLAALRDDGRAFLTPTVLGGRPAIRAAFSSWATTAEDVRVVAEALAALA